MKIDNAKHTSFIADFVLVFCFHSLFVLISTGVRGVTYPVSDHSGTSGILQIQERVWGK